MSNPVLDILIKATLLIVLALLVRVVWHRAAAATRHLLWALALGGILVLPIAERIGPAWHILPVARTAMPLPAENAAPVAPNGAVDHSGRLVAPATPTIAGSVRTAVVAVAAASNSWSLGEWLFAVWLAGVALVLAAYVVARIQVVRLARRAVPVTAPQWLGLRDVLAAQLDLDRPVALLTLAGQGMPMTWGTWRPVILLPAEADQWSEARRHDVLLHELAHVERRDCLTHLIAVCATAIYWFHPLVWVAARGLRVERERACDDRVIAGGARPSEYAEHLLEIAHGFAARPTTAFASLAMARPSHLATRLLDVLDARRRRDALTRRLALPGAVTAALLVLPVAALRPANPPAAAVSRVHPAAPSRLLADEDFRSPARRMSQSSEKSDTGDCAKSRASSTSETSHNRVVTLMVQVGHCVEELRATAPFKLNADFTDIAAIDDDGTVTVEQSGGDVDHRVELRAKGATITRRWFVDNSERPYDAAAREWFTATLTDLIRRTGYQAEERSRWVLKTRGVEGMFEEIALLDGDYAKRTYYQALVADGKAEPAVVTRVVTQAGKELTSSYDLAELLVLVGRVYPLTESLRTAFVAASSHLESDYDRHRVLSVVLTNRNLPDDLASAILASAGSITSDYDLAEVLVVLIQKHPITDGMREAFFKAVNHISSDYDRHRVLATLLAQQPPAGPALVADALASVGQISSSYDRAEVLVEVAGTYPLSESLRTPFFTATDGMDSDYDHARVLTALTEQSRLADPVIAGVIASAKKIESTSSRADVLVSLLQHNKLSAPLRQAYAEAAKDIDSEYDRNRALAALGGSQL
ncbi:MAG TPA: M56 family metallopeptidase [Gemmatimonadales bacterium]|nr:M56 family metallopeptidase [Gemmatimonadales bacterium]